MSSLRNWRATRLLFAMVLAFTVIGTAGLGTVAAQDAVECDSPGLPAPVEAEATPEAVEEEAPADDMADMDMGTPEAMEMPAPAPLPEGMPADPGVAGLINAAIANYAACFNEAQVTGDPGLFVALESDNYIAMSTESGDPAERVANESGGPPFTAELLSISNPLTYDDGRVSGDVELLLNNTWFLHQRMFLTLGPDLTWLLDEEAYLRPQPDAETVSVNGINITETVDEATGEVTYAFEFLGSPMIQQTEALIFNVTNSGAEVHEAAVVQLPEGADPLGILDGSIPFEEITFVGVVVPIFPGETRDLALLNLEPGTYTMLCFIPGPDGAPHAVNGMIGEFEVVAPEE